MGGHGMRRISMEYKQITLLAQKLAQNGFIIASGGGPGAMEAACLGAYLRDRSEEEVNQVFKLLATNQDQYQEDFENLEAVNLVLERFGYPTHMPCIGIPTYHYGHEPSNKFATWHAKFFSNAIREAGLIAIANGGVIFTPGSAGTRQEIFQDACKNHYGMTESPMIFYNATFWKENGIFDLVYKTSVGKPYHDTLLLSDDIQEILQFLLKHQQERNLPVYQEENLKRQNWSRYPKRPNLRENKLKSNINPIVERVIPSPTTSYRNFIEQ